MVSFLLVSTLVVLLADAHPGLLLHSFHSEACSGDTCKQRFDVQYFPYNFDASGVRQVDTVKFPQKTNSQLVMNLARSAMVSMCFPRIYHKETNDLCGDELGFLSLCGSGWEARTDLPFAVPNRRNRYRGSKKGIYGCMTVSKMFPAGEVIVNALASNSKHAHFIVTLEDVEHFGFTPMPTDLVPEGQPVPEPNELCPEWVQESMKEVDYRDGRLYNTWHPQWHRVFHCSMGHEHGSDPAIFGAIPYPNGDVKDKLQVSLDFVAFYNNQQQEPDIGFKGYAIRHDNDVNLYFVAHTTTSALSRVCARFHTVMVYGISKEGELLFELGYKADFGSARSRFDNNILEPVICPNQSEIFPDPPRKARLPQRRFRVRTIENKGYEKWLGADNIVNLDNPPMSNVQNVDKPLPLELDRFEIDIRNPITGCADEDCEEAYSTKGDGTRRTIRYSKIHVQYESEYDADGDGYFITDQYGFWIRDCELETCNPGNYEVIQYIKPGFEAIVNGARTDKKLEHFAPQEPWQGEYFPKTDKVEQLSIGKAIALGADGSECLCPATEEKVYECPCLRN